jgi:hypothetical protein
MHRESSYWRVIIIIIKSLDVLDMPRICGAEDEQCPLAEASVAASTGHTSREIGRAWNDYHGGWERGRVTDRL